MPRKKDQGVGWGGHSTADTHLRDLQPGDNRGL